MYTNPVHFQNKLSGCSNVIPSYCEWLGGRGPANLKLHSKSASSSNFAQNEEKFLTFNLYSFMWEKWQGSYLVVDPHSFCIKKLKKIQKKS